MQSGLSTLDIFAVGREWHIEPQFAVQQLAAYEHRLQLLRSGVPSASVFGANDPANQTQYITSENGTRIAVVSVDGAMMLSDGLCADGIRTIGERIKQAGLSSGVDAVVVKMNTGGGEVLAGQELYNAISSVKKPVIVSADYLASAGVLGTLSADAIYASGEFTKVGSIGVMVSVNKKFLQAYNEQVQNIYAETSPNKNSDFNELLKGNTLPLIQSLNETDKIFMDMVAAHRTLKGNEDTKQNTLSGAMFTASDAVKRGLIDGIASFDMVIQQAEQMAAKYKKGTFKKKQIKEKMISYQTLKAMLFGEDSTSAKIAQIEDGTKADAEKVDALAELIKEQIKASESVQAQVDNLTATVAETKNVVASQAETIEKLNANVERLESENNSLNELLRAVTIERDALQAENSKLNASHVSLKKQLADGVLASVAPNPIEHAADSAAIEKTVQTMVRKMSIKI